MLLELLFLVFYEPDPEDSISSMSPWCPSKNCVWPGGGVGLVVAGLIMIRSVSIACNQELCLIWKLILGVFFRKQTFREI